MKEILKKIPGFRSEKIWKKVIASIYYLISIWMLFEGLGYFLFYISLPFILFNTIDLIKHKRNGVPILGVSISVVASLTIFSLGLLLVPHTENRDVKTANNSNLQSIQETRKEEKDDNSLKKDTKTTNDNKQKNEEKIKLEKEELKKNVEFLQLTFDQIDEEFLKQQQNYNQIEWVEVTKNIRDELDKNKKTFISQMPISKLDSSNVDTAFKINDLYLKIHVDLIKNAWDELDGSDYNYETTKKEIVDIFNSIKID